MKICIPYQHSFWGPATFVSKFRSGMEQRGHIVLSSLEEDTDILFVIVQAPFQILLKARKFGIPIVQRLDGVFYWSVSGPMYPLLNTKATITRHLFSDFTVYQSEYSKKSVNRFLGKKSDEQQRVIYNGVDTNLFSPVGEKKDNLRDFPEQNIFFTVSDFRRKDQIFPILDALGYYRKKHGNKWKLVIAGAFRGELVGFEKKLTSYPNIQFVGKIENKDLPQYERAADIFLFTHLNPPCPNNIIEAMACGLPICGMADGAMPELVKHGENGYLLPIQGDAYWKQRFYDGQGLANHIAQTILQKESLSQKGRAIAVAQYSLENMLDRYEQVLLSLLKKI